MRGLLKTMIICVVVLMMLNIASASYAQDMGRKLFRGVINMASGWVELPKNVYVIGMEQSFASGMVIGVPKGILMAAVRTCAGIYDTLTFPIAFPKGYKPVLEPEFVNECK
jgi:putative exosortase-associated protein (TIGR04073 family)